MRFMTPIADRGGAEPYSDTNAPESLEITNVASNANIPTPASGRVVIASIEGSAVLSYKTSSGTVRTFGQYAAGSNFSNSAPGVVAPSTRAFTAANSMIWTPVLIPQAASITGIRFRKGTGTTAANVAAALYNQFGARVAAAGTTAAGTTASAIVTVPFTGVYNAIPGLYWIGLIGSSTSADFYGWAVTEYAGPATAATQGSFTTPTSFTTVATTTLASTIVPWMITY